ncbi:micrococcal nuclease, partial [Tremellales sp. Uapishka_1]
MAQEGSRPQSHSSPRSETLRRASDYSIVSPLESLTSLLPSFKSTPEPSKPSRSLLSYIPKDPVIVGILSAVLASGVTIGGIKGYRRYWRRLRNTDYVTSSMLDKKRWINGVVTSVGDGELKDETLHIRIAGVDAPEMAHFGNPEQPHGKESLEWLRQTLLGRRMKVQLLRKDQYNRIVGVPFIMRGILSPKPLPLLMLKEGMAVVYESGGSEYGDWGLEKFKAVEAEARAARRGLWSAKKIELPSDYKKRMKMAEEGLIGSKETARKEKSRIGIWGLVKKLLGRS